jgi:hypothetical protein
MKQFRILALNSCLLLLATSCKQVKTEEQEMTTETKRPVVQILTTNMEFQVQDTIPSGWNTFVYKNLSKEPHFFLIDKYPAGKTVDSMDIRVVPPFQKGMNLIMEGKGEEAMAAFGELPDWFQEVVFMGGSGLISPNSTAQNTLKLNPGNYILECYVKMADGTFHVSMGMRKALVVVESDLPEPSMDPDARVTISSTEGIVIKDTITKGRKMIAVDFIDQIVHENFVGHDVNLVKLDETANLEQLEAWMNWANPTGLMSPMPNGCTFLGGVNNLAAGSTGYFTVDLTPGAYVFIAEVPNSSTKNMLVPFSIE